MPLTSQQETVARALLSSGETCTCEGLQEALTILEGELRAALGPNHFMANDSESLRRFLIARQLKLEPTIHMIQQHTVWRKKTLPIALEGAVLAEERKRKVELRGTDTTGRPLVVIHSGRFDPRTRDLQGSVHLCFYMIELALKALPQGQTQFAVWYDRTGFSFKDNWDFDLLKAVFGQLSANYPERLGAAYVFPAGPPLPWLWGMVKVFLDPRTRAKVRMITETDELLACIPAEFVRGFVQGATHVASRVRVRP